MNLRRWTHPEHPLRLASAAAETVQRLRRRLLLRRLRRGLDIHRNAFKGPPGVNHWTYLQEDPHDPTKRTPTG